MFKVGDVVRLKINSENREYPILAVSEDGKTVTLWHEENANLKNINIEDLQIVFSRYEIEKRLDYLERKTGFHYEPYIPPEGFELAEPLPRIEWTFEDLVDLVDGRSLQRLFREIDDTTLAGVLYSCDTPERVNKIKKNVSSGHFSRLLDDIKLGIVSNSKIHVEEFVKVCRRLDEMGEIVIARGDEAFIDFDNIKPLNEEESAKLKQQREEWWKQRAEEEKKKSLERQAQVNGWLTRMGLK